MTISSAIILGIVQGVAEFLPSPVPPPVSVPELLRAGVRGGEPVFDVLLHLGTLIAVFVYYWKDIVALVKEFFHLITVCSPGRNGGR